MLSNTVTAETAAPLTQVNQVCPRCGQQGAVITDKTGVDVVLSRYYAGKGLGLIEVCMCADPRQLSVMFNNIYRRVRGVKAKNEYLACEDCGFWQIAD